MRARYLFLLAVSAASTLALVNCATEATSDYGTPAPKPTGTGDIPATDAGAPPARDGSTTSVGGDELPCDPGKPFANPRLVFGANVGVAAPRLSADELTIYVVGYGATPDLFRATRGSKTEAFGELKVITPQSSPDAGDMDPSVSADHLTLYFHSSRAGNSNLFFAKRDDVASPFGPVAAVPAVNDPNAVDAQVYLWQAGGELWFTSNRTGKFRLHRAKKSGEGFAAPTEVAELRGDWDDWLPMLPEDGLSLLLTSTRPNGKGSYDLWISERAQASGAWPAPMALAELNSAGADLGGWISADRCRIWYSTDRGAPNEGMQRVFVAERPR